MKKSLPILLSLLTAQVAMADMRSELRAYQRSLGAQPGGSAVPSPGARPGVVASSPQIAASSSTQCTETKQTSMPLSSLLDTVMDGNPTLTVEHDPRSGVLTISSPNMIGNCAAMFADPEISNVEKDGKKFFAVELKFKEGVPCPDDKKDGDKTCYTVMKKDGDQVSTEVLPFEASLNGYKKCLADSGVYKDSKLAPAAIYPQPFSHSFSGITESGSVVFKSHGAQSITEGPAFGRHLFNQSCDYYENITEQEAVLYTASEIESRSLNQQAESLRTCSISQLEELNRFIEENPAFSFLRDHRDSLLTQAAQSAASKIGSGQYAEEDFAFLQAFQENVINPRISEIRDLYQEIQNMPAGAQKTARQQELNRLKQQLAAFTNRPYFTAQHLTKLIQDGQFDAAEAIYGIRASAGVYAKIGQKINNVLIDSSNAEQLISEARAQNSEQMVTERDKYDVRTGQVTGRSEDYTRQARELTQLAQQTQQEFQELIAEETQAAQRQCSLQVWRTAQCMAEAQEDIQALRQQASEQLQKDQQDIAKLQQRATDYAELERQGRNYVAQQNGEQGARADRNPIKRSTASSRAGSIQVGASSQQSQQQQMLAYQQQQQQQQMLAWQQQMARMQGQNGMMSGSQYPGLYPQTSYNPFMMSGQTGYSSMYGMQSGNMMSGGLNFNLGLGSTGYNPYMQQQNPYLTNPYMQNTWMQPALMGSYSMYR